MVNSFNKIFNLICSQVCNLLDCDNKDEEEDDEEVFFGPQTHKEKCAAVVVAEQEVKPIEQLNPDEQAQILRESVLLSIKIKHGTPNSNIRGSPIAVVHPMLREASTSSETKKSNNPIEKSKRYNVSNKENVGPSSIVSSTSKDTTIKQSTSSIASSKLNPTPRKEKLSQSRLHQPKILGNTRISSQPDPVTTKLPVSKIRGKIQSEFSEVWNFEIKITFYGSKDSFVNS